MSNNNQIKRRKKDSARLIWDSKPRRAPNPKDIEFQTAEIVIPNPHRDQATLPMFMRDLTRQEINKSKMNRLIWGDNLLAMQALLAQGYEGKINLIYIDPPFWTGENYYANFTIEGKQFTKEPSVIERLAYKDIWAGGIDSFLDMLYPRLQLMKRLLAENGSIYVHCDWHVGHYIKIIMDEIFGRENFRNEIVWRKLTAAKAQSKFFSNVKDNIFLYTKTEKVIFNPQFIESSKDDKNYPYVEEKTGRMYGSFDLTQKGSGPPRYFGDKLLYPPPGKHWIWSQEKINKALEEGRIFFTSSGLPRVKRYLDEKKGNYLGDLWIDDEVKPLTANSSERIGFPTQKPEKLLERIIKASSNEGDLVADFFCGSGTTLTVAERLGRRWTGVDFSKVAIQVARNRLVNMDAKPFLVENIGNYQRQMIYLYGGRIYEMQRIVLKLYDAMPRKDYPDMGIRKAEDGITELIWVSYPDRPVTAKKVEELAKLAERLDGRGYKRLVILGWDYEYNFDQLWETRKRAMPELKVRVVPKNIPPEVYDYLKKAKKEGDIEPLKGKIFFHEKPYLKLMKQKIESQSSGEAKVTVGIERYVLFDIPIEKEKDRQKVLEIAKNNFAALIDYWSVDWAYDGFTFKSTWQAFRGFGKRVKTVPTKTFNELEMGKIHAIALRVVDIFGNDATATIKIDLRSG